MLIKGISWMNYFQITDLTKLLIRRIQNYN